ncbi:MAG TPA: hypothetical protein VHU92_15315 [Streptosporangiaceae bacterium]|jgi:hypothetical protein|nr:hypothetical protein [Streptosporangiaceae bacterium]
MRAPADTITASPSEQPHPPAGHLVSSWARGRRQFTPWAAPRLRALAAVRFTVGIFLTVLGALTISYGHDGWAVLILVAAALHFSIASLDITAARSAPRHT